MTTRSKKKAVPKENAKPTIQRVENSWILLIKDTLFKNSNFSIVTIPHPRGDPTKYCLDDIHKKIYEVVTYNEPHRSWFIGDTVKSDGSILMLTPMNPLFIVLPLLREECSTRAVPLEDLLSRKGYDKILDFIKNLDNIGDLKGPADLKAYKYNESKTLDWLEAKVRSLAEVLRKKNIHVTSGAISTTFVASNVNNDNVDEEFYLKYAHGMISEYLQDDLIELLEKRFNFKAELIETVGKKRKSEGGESLSKRIKSEPIEDSKENADGSFENVAPKKEKPMTAKEKALQKAASKTKTISSFFAKK